MPSEINYPQALASQPLFIKEQDVETALVEKLRGLKYTERSDIRDRINGLPVVQIVMKQHLGAPASSPAVVVKPTRTSALPDTVA